MPLKAARFLLATLRSARSDEGPRGKNRRNFLALRAATAIYQLALASPRGAQEESGEGTHSVPDGKHVPRLPGGNFPGYGASVPSGRRKPRSEAALAEAHRRQRCRRAPHRAGGCIEGAHSFGRQRAGTPRAAPALQRQLSHILRVDWASLGAFVFCALATACDRGSFRADKAYSEPLRVTGASFGPSDGGAP